MEGLGRLAASRLSRVATDETEAGTGRRSSPADARSPMPCPTFSWKPARSP